MTYYVYPKIFKWDHIIPADYPFINVKGPSGTMGVLLVFENLEDYKSFQNDDPNYLVPITIGGVDGKKQD